MKTHLKKTGRGWQAETTIELDANRVLFIRTARSQCFSAALVTSAIVWVRDWRGVLVHASACADDVGDFLRAVQVSPVQRLTKHVVRDQQERALATLDTIKGWSERHYAGRHQSQAFDAAPTEHAHG